MKNYKLTLLLPLLALTSCVSHTTITAKTVNVTASPTLSIKASGLPLSLP